MATAAPAPKQHTAPLREAKEERISALNKMFQRAAEERGAGQEFKVKEPEEQKAEAYDLVDQQQEALQQDAESAQKRFSQRLESFKEKSSSFREYAEEQVSKFGSASSQEERESNSERRELLESQQKERNSFYGKWEHKFNSLSEKRRADVNELSEKMGEEVSSLLASQQHEFNSLLSYHEQKLENSPNRDLGLVLKEVQRDYAGMSAGFSSNEEALLEGFKGKQSKAMETHSSEEVKALGEFRGEEMRLLQAQSSDLQRARLKADGASEQEVKEFDELSGVKSGIADSFAFIARHAASVEEIDDAEKTANKLIELVSTGVSADSEKEFEEAHKHFYDLAGAAQQRVGQQEAEKGELDRQAESRIQMTQLINDDMERVAEQDPSFDVSDFMSSCAPEIIDELSKYKEPEKAWDAVYSIGQKLCSGEGAKQNYSTYYFQTVQENVLINTDFRFMVKENLFETAREESPEFFNKAVEENFPQLNTNIQSYVEDRYPIFKEFAQEKNIDIRVKGFKRLGSGTSLIGAYQAEIEVFSNGELMHAERLMLKGTDLATGTVKSKEKALTTEEPDADVLRLRREALAGVGLKPSSAGSVEGTALDILKEIYPERYSNQSIIACPEGYMLMTIITDASGNPALTYGQQDFNSFPMDTVVQDAYGLGESAALALIGFGDRHGENAIPVGPDRTRVEIDFGQSFREDYMATSMMKVREVYSLYVKRLAQINNAELPSAAPEEKRKALEDKRREMRNSFAKGFADACKRIHDNKDGIEKVLRQARSKELISEDAVEVTADDLDWAASRVNELALAYEKEENKNSLAYRQTRVMRWK